MFKVRLIATLLFRNLGYTVRHRGMAKNICRSQPGLGEFRDPDPELLSSYRHDPLQIPPSGDGDPYTLQGPPPGPPLSNRLPPPGPPLSNRLPVMWWSSRKLGFAGIGRRAEESSSDVAAPVPVNVMKQSPNFPVRACHTSITSDKHCRRTLRRRYPMVLWLVRSCRNRSRYHSQ